MQLVTSEQGVSDPHGDGHHHGSVPSPAEGSVPGFGRGLVTGLATTAIETVLRAMDDRGTTIAELWCLEENRRARRLYEYLGWRAAPDRRPAPWPPHPTEMRYTRLIPQSDR